VSDVGFPCRLHHGLGRHPNLILALLLEVNEWDLYVVENQSLVLKAATLWRP
jgi:hypothetical protein